MQRLYAGTGKNKSCQNCNGTDFEEKKAVEVGNIFKLNTKYSSPFDLKFKDKDSKEKTVIMGCYGIGLGRVLGTIVEVNHDDKGIIWPKSVAPFLAHLIEINPSAGSGQAKKVKATATKIYQELKKNSIQVLYDDRQDKSAGEKLVEADFLGMPVRIVVSEKTLALGHSPTGEAKNSVEIKERSKNSAKLVKIKQLSKLLK